LLVHRTANRTSPGKGGTRRKSNDQNESEDAEKQSKEEPRFNLPFFPVSNVGTEHSTNAPRQDDDCLHVFDRGVGSRSRDFSGERRLWHTTYGELLIQANFSSTSSAIRYDGELLLLFASLHEEQSTVRSPRGQGSRHLFEFLLKIAQYAARMSRTKHNLQY
jgi:hypothetical protein